jgi:hypothetical protein
MKNYMIVLLLFILPLFSNAQTYSGKQKPSPVQLQNQVAHPTLISTPAFFGISFSPKKSLSILVLFGIFFLNYFFFFYLILFVLVHLVL